MFNRAFFYTLFTCNLISIYCLSQEKTEVPILKSEAFDKTISQNITYAITGENVPTGGLKVDLTKATGTVTGYLAGKNVDYSLDIGLGITEGSSALFNSYKNLHSDFNATLNIIYIPHSSSAKMYVTDANILRRTFASYESKLTTNRNDSLLCVILIAMSHKLKVIDENGKEILLNIKEFVTKEIEASEQLEEDEKKDIKSKALALVDRADLITNPKCYAASLTSDQQKLVKDLVKRYFLETISTDDLCQMLRDLSTKGDACLSHLLLDDLLNVVNKYIGTSETNDNYQIKYASTYWTIKNLHWWTLSPFVKRQGFSLFEQDILQRDDTSSTTYGAGIRYNWLWDMRKGLVYVRTGIDIFRANNLSDFKKVEYIEQDSVTSSGSKSLYSESKGISYTGDTLSHKVGYKFSLEFYVFFSKKNFVPGIYGRFDYTISKAYDKNYIPILEFGAPFNINSSDKKKSVVSIAPYIRYENLNAVDDPEIENEIKRKDFLMGIRVGLPISIASR